MRRLFSWAVMRTLLVLLALAIAALVIWFVGPLVAIGRWRPLDSVSARLILIGVIVALWLLLRLLRWWRSRATNAALLGQLAKEDTAASAAAPGGTAQSAEEVAELRKRFEAALATLKKSSATAGRAGMLGGFGRRYVYQMPWYMFIGAPGSGKTTALVNSGLEFPLADKFGKAAVRGVGGTRNCDWWFTNEAVLIDTAGRYTTQESNVAQDRAEWEGFLGLLRKYRPQAPINGVILTISVGDLLGSTQEERENHAAAIRRRLTELQDQLKIRVPVYAIVTKVDLLAGFNEYFGRLTQEDRAQVWGLTFPANEEGEPVRELPATFESEYRLLERRIEDALPDLLQAEPDVQRRALIYAFTQQFAGLRDVLGQFLATLFAQSKFAQPPLVRGVYLTSGTQEGTPFDRVLGSMRRRFGVDARVEAGAVAQGTGKSYFLKDLLQKLVFAEWHLVGRNPTRERRRRTLQLVGIGACVIALIGASIAWTVSYTHNRSYLAEVAPKAAALAKDVQATPNTAGDYVSLLPILNAASGLAASQSFNVDHPPASYRAGLYQGFKMATAAEAAYDRLLEDLLLPRVALRLAALLAEAPADNLEALYGRLKAYLMLYEPDHYRPEFLTAAVSADWQANVGPTLTAQAQQELAAHLRALFEGRVRASPFPRDNALVTQARARLGRYTQAQRVYGQLKGTIADKLQADFNVVNAVGADAKLVFARTSGKPLDEGVPGLYTRVGYRAIQERLSDRRLLLALDETWVLGTPEKSAAAAATDILDERLLTEIRQLYLTDYRQAWDVYLADLRLVPAPDLSASVQLVRILSAPDSPLPKFIKAVADETTLAETGKQGAGLADRATEAMEKAGKSAVQRVFGTTTASVIGTPSSPRAGQIERQYVDAYFEPWRRLAAPPASGGDPLRSLLNDLYTTLLATEAAVRSGNLPPQTDTANRVRAEAGRMPVPLRGMLESMVASSSSQAAGVARTNLGAQMNMAVGDACRKSIAGRYPFNRTSPNDVPLGDFAQLFATGGLLDDFFQKNLAAVVDMSTNPWSFKKGLEGSTPGGAASLSAFQQAAKIRSAFFRVGVPTPQYTATVRVVELDPAAKELVLDVGGQSLKYARGSPENSRNFVWPAPDGGSQVRLALDGAPGLRAEGPWALHHLFDQAKITPSASPERFTAAFNVNGRAATLEVVAGSVYNPFRLRELETFSCPGKL